MDSKNNMKKAREHAGLSQKEVAITLKVTPPTISEWESGRKNPNASNLKELSKLYKVSSDYLIGLSDTSISENDAGKKLFCLHPVSMLASLYGFSTDVLTMITGADRINVEKWVQGIADPDEENLAIISEFFQIDLAELKRGEIPLFPNEDIKKKIKQTTQLRFAAYRKDDDFTQEEIKDIQNYIDFVRTKRKGGQKG